MVGVVNAGKNVFCFSMSTANLKMALSLGLGAFKYELLFPIETQLRCGRISSSGRVGGGELGALESAILSVNITQHSQRNNTSRGE